MAFVPGFEYDIFISYAHVDNQTVSDVREGWIDQFHKHLQLRLSMEFGRMDMVHLWRDDKLERGQLFDKTIQDALDGSAVFVSLTSRGHLASEYCQNEVEWFHKKTLGEAEGPAIHDRSRLVNCLINDIHYTEWPAKLTGTSGYPLFDQEEDGDPTDPHGKLFKRQIRNLSKYLFTILHEFRKHRLAGTGNIKKHKKDTESADIFIAEVPDSLRSTKKRLLDELANKGYRVATGFPPPYDFSGHTSRVNNQLSKVVMSVHLLDQFAGREIDDKPEITYPQYQTELAKKTNINSFIWVPKQLNLSSVDDEGHRKFLEDLEQNERHEVQYEFIRGTSTELTLQLVDELEKRKVEKPMEEPAKAILLDTHLKDQMYAWKLGEYFIGQNIQPFINPQKDDPNENLEILESRLAEVNMLMILFGHVKAEWVIQRLAAALKLSVLKKLSLKAFCVVNVPPKKPAGALPFDFGPIPVHVIDTSSGQLDPSRFAPILEKLQNNSTP